MSGFRETGLPLPEGYTSFEVQTRFGVQLRDDEGYASAKVQGYVFDPASQLAEEGTPVVIGASNTYGTNPYSPESLQVAHDLHQATDLPVVAFETYGAHGRQTQRLAWEEGSESAEHYRGALHGETLRYTADALGLFGRPLHWEGHSQGAFITAARLDAARPEDGFVNDTATLFDPSGMRWYPKIGVMPRVLAVIRDYEKNHKPSRRPMEPAEAEIASYAAEHPDVASYHFPGDINPSFIIERVGARPFTERRLLASLVRNPDLTISLISCARGNGAHTSVASDEKLQRKADFLVGPGRLKVYNPDGLLHQWADRPLNRASLLSAVIRGDDPSATLAVD